MANLGALTNTSDRNRRRLAWAAPVVVAGAVAAGVVVGTATPSNASPTLPARTAKQLLVALQTHRTTALSGVVHENAALGIPSLPGDSSTASLSWQTFITGSHNAKVWVDGADRQRVALLGELSEAEVVHNGNDVWTYTSDTNTVTHTTLNHRDSKAGKRTGARPASAPDFTPAAAADQVLKAISPSTKVDVESTQRVAGRAAYTLVLRPRDTRSTVRKVTIAIDAARYLPLQVQVYGAGSTPAFEIGFSQVAFGTPAASTFHFTMPKGATVSSNPLTSDRHGDHRRADVRAKAGAKDGAHAAHATSGAAGDARTRRPGIASAPKAIGTGWTTVFEIGGGADAIGNLGGRTLTEATTSVGHSGARLLHTALVNVVILPDGRVFAGAVQPALLEHIAATTAR